MCSPWTADPLVDPHFAVPVSLSVNESVQVINADDLAVAILLKLTEDAPETSTSSSSSSGGVSTARLLSSADRAGLLGYHSVERRLKREIAKRVSVSNSSLSSSDSPKASSPPFNDFSPSTRLASPSPACAVPAMELQRLNASFFFDQFVRLNRPLLLRLPPTAEAGADPLQSVAPEVAAQMLVRVSALPYGALFGAEEVRTPLTLDLILL